MTDAERLIERLRRKAYRREIWHEPDGTMDVPCDKEDEGAEEYFINPDGPEAAALIQQQAARIVELEVALQPFARGGAAANEEWKDSDDIGFLAFSTFEVTVGDFRMARAVLGEKP